MASMENTGYGKAVRNFMASANIGSLTVGQEAIQTTAMALSSLPPPEIALFHYQQMYLANAHDSAGFALEVEQMANFGRDAGNWGYGVLDEGKNEMRGIRTDDYNELEYFSTDPLRAALLRPDKLTGDLFEKVIPSIVSLYLPGKATNLAQMQRGATLMTQLGWIAKRAFNTAGSDKLMDLIQNPEKVDRNPEYRKYLDQSRVAETHPEQARQYFIEGEARKSGAMSAVLGIATAVGSHQLMGATATGTEGPLLQWFQEFVLDQAAGMTKEAINAPAAEYIDEAIRDRRKEKPKYW